MELGYGCQRSDSRACVLRLPARKCALFFLPDCFAVVKYCSGMEPVYVLCVRSSLAMFPFQRELHSACYDEIMSLLEAL